jgi:hypothetical protein
MKLWGTVALERAVIAMFFMSAVIASDSAY